MVSSISSVCCVTGKNCRSIVYNGKAAFEGVCVNDFIETGLDLLNSLADILARFRLGKFAMIADLTKCLFQIGLPAEQRHLFCFEREGIGPML